MTILVTGAGGGFGTALLSPLRAHYNETVIGAGRSHAVDSGYIRCDFTKATAVRELIKSVRPRLIFHLVGSFTGEFETDLQVNAVSAKHLFENIISEHLNTRVVIFGSAAEYGAVLPSDNPISETFPCRPVSIYGLTKAIQTDIARFYARTKNIDVVVARVFNLAASGLSSRLFYGRAEAMILSYRKGEISQLEFGNLDSERDYIALDDALDQLLAVAEFGLSGEIYNIANGYPRKIRLILADMLEKEGLREVEIVESTPEVISEKGYDVSIIYANTTKVSKLMGLM